MLPNFSTPKSGQVLQLLWTESASPPITTRPNLLRHDAFPLRGRFLLCSGFLCFSLYPVHFLLHSHWRCYVIVRRLRLRQSSVRITTGLDYPTWTRQARFFLIDDGLRRDFIVRVSKQGDTISRNIFTASVRRVSRNAVQMDSPK